MNTINTLAMKQFTCLSKIRHGIYVKCISICLGSCLIEPITYVLPVLHNLSTQASAAINTHLTVVPLHVSEYEDRVFFCFHCPATATPS